MATSSNNEPPSSPSEWFSFIMPASIFKHAIGALSDSDLNSSGKARIDVSEAGFEITVRGDSVEQEKGDPVEVVGLLSLNAAALIDFKCNIRVAKMIKLDRWSKFVQSMETVGDNDMIKFFSSNGTVLSFSFFKVRPTGVQLRNIRNIPQLVPVHRQDLETRFINSSLLKKFPTVSCAFEVALPSDTLKPLLRSITEDIDSSGNPAKLARASVQKKVCIKAGTSQLDIKGDTQYMWFNMTNWMALKTASRLTDTCYFYYVKDPSEHIMLRYCLKELGDFVILKTTRECFVEKQPALFYTFGSRT